METILTIVHVLVCLFLVGIVLLQHGKGADIGASFGGSSQSLFGSEGPLPLLNKITTGVAVLFMITSVSLAYIAANSSTGSIMKDLSQQQAVEQAEQAEEQQPAATPAPEETPAPAGQPSAAADSQPTGETPAKQ